MVGNISKFTKIDILRCFLRFHDRISRKELANELMLGEGTVRTILSILKSRKLLNSSKKGHLLSRKGTEMLSNLRRNIEPPKIISVHNLYPEYKKIGVLVRNAKKLKQLYKLRDIAVKHGADGAVILKFHRELYAPESEYKMDFKSVKKCFNLRNGDVVVIAFSDKVKNAENGALAIAIELNDFLKRFINEL